VLAALAVLGPAKSATAFVTVRSEHRPADSVAPSHAATALLVRSRRLLSVLLAGPMLALAVALPVLAWSGDTAGIAMTTVASVALLVRARQAGFDNELVPLGGAGLAGVFAVLAVLSRRIWHSGAAISVTLVVGGLLLVAIGVVTTVRRSAVEAVPELPPGFPATAGQPSRRLIDLLGVFCQTAAAALALGVFGVFGDLVAMGRGLVG
jgi:hypothetical protein